MTGPDVVALCNSGSLFGGERLVLVTDIDGQKKDPTRPGTTGGWKAVDVDAITAYLASPAPETVLALIGLEVKKDAAIAKACAKSGDLLIFDVAKRGRVAWVAERFRQAGVKAETDACALLIEYVGEDDLHGLANEIVKIATWAQGEPVGVAEIEQLVSPVADVPPYVAHRRLGRPSARPAAGYLRDALRPLRQGAAGHGSQAGGDAQRPPDPDAPAQAPRGARRARA